MKRKPAVPTWSRLWIKNQKDGPLVLVPNLFSGCWCWYLRSPPVANIDGQNTSQSSMSISSNSNANVDANTNTKIFNHNQESFQSIREAPSLLHLMPGPYLEGGGYTFYLASTEAFRMRLILLAFVVFLPVPFALAVFFLLGRESVAVRLEPEASWLAANRLSLCQLTQHTLIIMSCLSTWRWRELWLKSFKRRSWCWRYASSSSGPRVIRWFNNVMWLNNTWWWFPVINFSQDHQLQDNKESIHYCTPVNNTNVALQVLRGDTGMLKMKHIVSHDGRTKSFNYYLSEAQRQGSKQNT